MKHRHETKRDSSPIQQPTRSQVPALLALVLSLVTGFLLWLSHYPLAQGWAAWFALVPWLMLVRWPLGRWQRYTFAWLGGMAFFLPALQWMRYAHDAMFYSWIGLALYCSWFFPLNLYLIRFVDRRSHWPLTISVPLVWCVTEWGRGWLLSGFPWYFLAHTQHELLPIIQLADLAGASGVSFLVAMVNGLLAECLEGTPACKVQVPRIDTRSWNLRRQILGIEAVLILVVLYGGWRLGQTDFAPGPRVALLQTNLPQGLRNALDDPGSAAAADAALDIERQAFELTVQAKATNPDLIVWPETTFEFDNKELLTNASFDPAVQNWLRDCNGGNLAANRALYCKTNVLYGINTQVLHSTEKILRYNSSLLFNARGDRIDRYDKIHLVPFGEFVPFIDQLPFLKYLAPYDGVITLLTHGERFTRFPLQAQGRDFTFGVLICYEDSYASLAREYVKPGSIPPVDFLINQSNDGWFMGSAEHAEHLAVSRFRAIECRRALARAVNVGISAIIDGNGRILALPAPTLAESKNVKALVEGMVPIDGRSSLFARLGDWLPLVCGIVLSAVAFRARFHLLPDATAHRGQ